MFFHSKKGLEMFLESIPRFKKAKRKLEQYVTPSNLAAEILWLALEIGDIKGKVVADLGCGTGRLTVGAALLGAKEVLGIDVDVEPLKQLSSIIKELNLNNVHIINANVPYVPLLKVDTVIQNPPFGVWRRHADIEFLTSAFKFSNVIYSIHKSNIKSRRLIVRVAKELKFTLTHIFTRTIHIPQMFETHTRRTYRFKVDVYRFSKGQ